MQKQLTQTDRKKLKGKLWFTSSFILIVIAFFYGMYHFIVRDALQKTDGFGTVPLVIFGIFGLIFLGIVGYMMSIFIKDLKADVKNCYEGVIEDKKLHIKKTTSNTSSSGSRGRRSNRTSTKRYFYMTVNGEEHKIEYPVYASIKVGDTIYFEVAPNSKTILSYKILESEAVKVVRNTPKLHRNEYPNSRIRQAPLTREDQENMYGFYTVALRKRLTIIAFMAFPILGLMYVDLLGLIVFLFPIPIILIYQLYKVSTLYVNYKKTINNGRKDVIETHITDKLFTTISNNGRKSSTYKLVTTYKTIAVPETIYGNFNTGDEIVVHKASHLPAVMGISILDTYYPLTT
ncbi:hypothetical protein KORDIASMS9_03015 [Kordia sp. SMS9]|uniref:hypothetical protein n=1 Tax=Kordia sp. SMS9 TaxID=2282170 RepID=UPI000E0D6D45|nr:hypothetical protein [Kordia sp. SMS9]AXG70769.1 hypothetical protein KORDIASMS9_03015 [Kordia sp. SMS9]